MELVAFGSCTTGTVRVGQFPPPPTPRPCSCPKADATGLLPVAPVGAGNAPVIAIQGSLVDQDDLKQALSLFDPVWEQLFPKEQTRIMKLLIQQIDYHGGESTLEITFRDVGIKALREELADDE